MDIRMPGTDGIEATQQIAAAGSLPKVLVLTTFDLDEYAFGALRAGASGFLLKDVRPGELVAAIRTVAAGDAPGQATRAEKPAQPSRRGPATAGVLGVRRDQQAGASRAHHQSHQYLLNRK